MSKALSQAFEAADAELLRLEVALREGVAPPLAATVDTALAVAKSLMRAYTQDRVAGAEAHAQGAAPPAPADLAVEDPLELFKVFVKGDPSLNAVRDNLRELVYYRNCLDQQREDALPPRPVHMAVRTARHIYLYLRTRCLKEGRLSD